MRWLTVGMVLLLVNCDAKPRAGEGKPCRTSDECAAKLLCATDDSNTCETHETVVSRMKLRLETEREKAAKLATERSVREEAEKVRKAREAAAAEIAKVREMAKKPPGANSAGAVVPGSPKCDPADPLCAGF